MFAERVKNAIHLVGRERAESKFSRIEMGSKGCLGYMPLVSSILKQECNGQGSGKSIVMVLLAKWILENNPNARVAIITARDELDKQIERVFTEVGEPIKRTTSGSDLMRQLSQATPRLLCSLVHKFGRKDVDNFDAFIKELEAQP